MSVNHGTVKTKHCGAKIAELKKFFDSCTNNSKGQVSCHGSVKHGSGVNKLPNSDNGTDNSKQKVIRGDMLALPVQCDNDYDDVALVSSDKNGITPSEVSNGVSNSVKDSSLRNGDCVRSDPERSAVCKDPKLDRGKSRNASNDIICTENNALWNGVDIGLNPKCDFNLRNANRNSIPDDIFNGNQIDDEFSINHDAVTQSTTELHNLIATSKAELSKNSDVIPPKKSTLENYFAHAFENNKPKRKAFHMNPVFSSAKPMGDKCVPHPDAVFSEFANDANLNESQNYEFHCNEMFFDDVDDTVLSDASSDEELKGQISPVSNNNMMPFSLHTIVEESCEESERDSETATPTNHGPSSQLEKYFSWDIVNQLCHHRREGEENSTIYSDSLSEASESLNGEDIEPAHFSSSRLEKYFTSGLIGNDNYQYPEDAEFLDDASVSDFDDDDHCHKISRSALLSSLDISTKSVSEIHNSQKAKLVHHGEDVDVSSSNMILESNEISNECDLGSNDGLELVCEEIKTDETKSVLCDSSQEVPNGESSNSVETSAENNKKPCPSPRSCNSTALAEPPSDQSDCITNGANHTTSTEKNVDVDTLACDLQKESSFNQDTQKMLSTIISKLTNLLDENDAEMNYILAWSTLESEVEQLVRNGITNGHLENHSGSSNSSTFGSSNSDYGSDTVDSAECLTTDEDDNCTDSRIKTKRHSSQTSSPNLKPYKKCNNMNGVTENPDLWKSILDTLCRNKFSQLSDLNREEFHRKEGFFRDHIVMLLQTLSHSCDRMSATNYKNPTIDTKSILNVLRSHKFNELEDLIESSSKGSDEPSCQIEEEALSLNVILPGVDEGISIDSNENLFHESEIVPSLPEKVLVEESSPQNDLATDLALPLEVELFPTVAASKDIVQNAVFSINEDTIVEAINSEIFSAEEQANIEEQLQVPTSSESPSLDNDDSTSQVSIYVDIEIGDKTTSVTERNCDENSLDIPNSVKRASLHLWVSPDDSEPKVIEAHSHRDSVTSIDPATCDGTDEKSATCAPASIKAASESNLVEGLDVIVLESDCTKERPSLAHRDTGYFSTKSEESICDHRNECSSVLNPAKKDSISFQPNLARSSIKSNPSTNILSRSTVNVFPGDGPDLKFSTLQPRTRAPRVSMNPQHSPHESRPISSYFSPLSMLKKLKSSKGTRSELSYPSKYLKKYGRSCSFDVDSVCGATSMPHLNQGDSHSLSGCVVDGDGDSSLIIDDNMELRKPYSKYSQSVMSLGAHSASTTSVYSAAGGRHFGYVSISGDVLFGLNYNQKSETMEVFVKQCRNLAAVDAKKNKSDPYVKVYLLPDKTKGGKRKTKTKRNTLNPVYNELLRFPLPKNELESRTMWLSIWNSDIFGRNDFLGEVNLVLGYRLLDSPTLRWYPLQERTESLTNPLTYKGELFLALKYVPKDLCLEPRFRPAPVISLTGALHILVKEARNISTSRCSGALDAFCKSYLLPDKSKTSKQKTPIVKKSRHPKWYYTVIYENVSIDELKERSLELTLWDHDKLTSNEFMGGIRLNCGTGLYHGIPVDWMDSSRDESILWQAMLERPNMWVDCSLPLRPTMQSTCS